MINGCLFCVTMFIKPRSLFGKNPAVAGTSPTVRRSHPTVYVKPAPMSTVPVFRQGSACGDTAGATALPVRETGITGRCAGG